MHRNLSGPVDASQSLVIGNGTSTVVAFSPYQVKVVARNSAGVNLNRGGDTFEVQIRNECTPGPNFSCTPVSGATQVLPSPLVATMTDNTDGT